MKDLVIRGTDRLTLPEHSDSRIKRSKVKVTKIARLKRAWHRSRDGDTQLDRLNYRTYMQHFAMADRGASGLGRPEDRVDLGPIHK